MLSILLLDSLPVRPFVILVPAIVVSVTCRAVVASLLWDPTVVRKLDRSALPRVTGLTSLRDSDYGVGAL